jgi:ketosteroid isomerase-like protein
MRIPDSRAFLVNDHHPPEPAMRLRLRLPLLALLAAAIGCHASFNVNTSGPAASEAAIRARLDSTALGWNRGELPMYLAMYDPEATVMGATGVEHGHGVVEAQMRRGFWRTGRPAQQLAYDQVEVRMLGDRHALVTGRFTLSGGGRPDRVGYFTTVWADSDQGWRMVHDHSG